MEELTGEAQDVEAQPVDSKSAERELEPNAPSKMDRSYLSVSSVLAWPIYVRLRNFVRVMTNLMI
ncbi:hypothetical protein OHA77_13030 [Streptosporangium sp. NBC_01639]|uniref:hypothetical protein n=1 Tax=Streptosporangium sp. NBC_01639 TaxID=2975948 RepID=UPI00386DFB9B|nr:hypothetical protein OHA77_13030 [Streptosporangium sp. NBC_01639]